MTARTEFGLERTECGCRTCRRNCMFMPGFLIPADLLRMVPRDVEPFEWAEVNLLASPGALVSKDGELFRIPTLVPATKFDGSCKFYQKRKCTIHGVSPFGCAMFDCSPERGNLASKGLVEVHKAWLNKDLYAMLWRHLWDLSKRQESADVLRERMMA